MAAVTTQSVVVDALLVDDDEEEELDEELLIVDDMLLFDVVVTRQEQAEETRGRELAQGPERAVGVGEGALEGLVGDHSSGFEVGKTEAVDRGIYGVASCFVQKAVSLLL